MTCPRQTKNTEKCSSHIILFGALVYILTIIIYSSAPILFVSHSHGTQMENKVFPGPHSTLKQYSHWKNIFRNRDGEAKCSCWSVHDSYFHAAYSYEYEVSKCLAAIISILLHVRKLNLSTATSYLKNFLSLHFSEIYQISKLSNEVFENCRLYMVPEVIWNFVPEFN